ncbi:MAG: CinA family nicotinamide mononucleotide deamidase-related protein [Candidatus Cloacimonadaceae bacterium]|nr:CinA family nicotinamide mononucleotide deamidase-related protein [Candidatus Cloacimonadaceae bacterium]MDP3114111.1 CinA family nicotinamide mononucleotide deamidase-related protein [Candidatus Cloacimonadaceae bacterium]
MIKCAVISIGNELLLGRTVNSNFAYLASELARMGIDTQLGITCKDEPDAIREALGICVEKCDLIISTGGLGPTADDITKSMIAEYFGKELVFDEKIWEHVQKLFAVRGVPTAEINRNQAMLPRGFSALHNDRGTAPGLWFEYENKCFIALAGVPMEMRHVFENRVKPLLKAKFSGLKPIIQKTVHTFNISESALAELIPQNFIPKETSMAWLPQTGRVDLRFYGSNESDIDQCVNRVLELAQDYVWGIDEDTPVKALNNELRKRGLTLSVAESCTGGGIGAMITAESGASDVFLGGVICYSDDIKRNVLSVRDLTLKEKGAVSAETTAIEMVRGIKLLTDSACAISVTGIAGPLGGTESKPVGTVYFAFVVFEKIWSLKSVFSGGRDSIRHKAAEFAILHLLKYLQGSNA